MILGRKRKGKTSGNLKTLGNVHKYISILPQLSGAEPWKIRMGSAKVLSFFVKS